MRKQDWEYEVEEALWHLESAKDWSLHGENRLVKVVEYVTIMNLPREKTGKARGAGFVTMEKYLHGKTPYEIERDLGLRPFSLQRGCRVFRLARLPETTEFTYEMTADFPDGEAFDFKNREDAHGRMDHLGWTGPVPFYPPGSSRVRQWRVSVAIPLVHIIDLYPNVAYPKGLP